MKSYIEALATSFLTALLGESTMSLPSVYRCRVCEAYVEGDEHCSSPTGLLLDSDRRIKLSKLLTAILRHAPGSIGLRLSNGGWTRVNELVVKIESHKPHYQWLTEELVKVVATLDPKGRFELKGNLIRARYGHSRRLEVEVEYKEDRDAKTLYHGTSISSLNAILREGIKPMNRVMVHASSSIRDAIEAALRKGKKIVVFEINADKLRQEGFKVYKASDKIYVTRYVPPSAIRRYKVMTFS